MIKSNTLLLQNILREWWARPIPRIYPRDLDLRSFVNIENSVSSNQLTLSISENVRKVISVIGFRRVGKTYLLLDLAKNIGQENCVYINFEDERIPKNVTVLTDLLDVLTEISGNKSYFLLLDEIQNIPNWSVWARRVVETTNHQLIVSGSSSKLASSELPTELRGRSLSVKVNPLNFSEFAGFKNIDISNLPKPQILNLMHEFARYGGFPEVVLSDEGKKYLLIDEYFQTFLQRDIVERHRLRKSQSLALLINLLLNSKEYGVRKLANTISSLDSKIGKHTVTKYLTYLHESFFLKNLYLHNRSLKNRLQALKKAYFVDSSFISRKASSFSDNIGRLMEQKISEKLFAEIEKSPAKGLFYWKNRNNLEVDFVIRENEKTIRLIQACYISDLHNLPDREVKALKKAAEDLECENLEIVTWDLEIAISSDKYKIKCIPMWKYLIGY